MKKTLSAIFAMACVAAFGAGAAHARQPLGAAIQGAAAELSEAFVSGHGVAVLAMASDSARMSDHLINETIVAFMGMQHARGISVVNRVQLNAFAEQLGFDPAAEMDDATARSLGARMNARFVVTGAFEPRGDFFHFSARVTDVQTLAVRDAGADVQNDLAVASLLGVEPSPEAVAAAAAARQARYRAARERRPLRDPPNVNWLSIDLYGVGGGVRYERDLNDFFALGATVFWAYGGAGFGVFPLYDRFDDRHSHGFVSIAGGLATARLFLGRSPFYFEAGLGLGFEGWLIVLEPGYSSEDLGLGSPFGPMVSLGFGARLGGRRRGFFANPFVNVLLTRDGVYLNPGIGLGGAWQARGYRAARRAERIEAQGADETVGDAP